MSITKDLAEQLFRALNGGSLLAPISPLLDGDIDRAYAVQDALVALRLERGERIVGKKIGLTSEAVQQQLGVDQPDYGVLFDTMNCSSTGSLPFDQLQQPKVEGELAFVLGADLLNPECTMEQLVHAIKEVRASIEIVGSRIENWNIKIADTVADNASASHFILGEDARPLAALDPAALQMKLWRGSDLVSQGSGAACMGNPLNAALWLARKMAHMGRPLLRGEVVLSGALGPMHTVAKGERIRLELEGFDPLEIQFE